MSSFPIGSTMMETWQQSGAAHSSRRCAGDLTSSSRPRAVLILCTTAHTLNSSQPAQHFAGTRSQGVAALSCQRVAQLRNHPRQHHARLTTSPSPSPYPQITGRARPSAGGRRAPGACGSSRLLRAGSRTASAAAPSRRRRLRRPSRGAVVPRPPLLVVVAGGHVDTHAWHCLLSPWNSNRYLRRRRHVAIAIAGGVKKSTLDQLLTQLRPLDGPGQTRVEGRLGRGC